MKKHVFDFGTLYLHDDYLIAIMNEGVHIIPEMNAILVEIANTYYKERAFVY